MLRVSLAILAALAAPAAAEVRLDRVTVFPGRLGPAATGVKYQQTWRGLDVVGGSIYVRTDEQGLVRWSGGAARPLPDDLSDTPLVDPREAVFRLGRGVLPEAHTELVVWAPPGRTPRLAWRVYLPRDLDRMETLRAYLDARSGALLSTENLIKSIKQARVFPTNPTASTLTTVALDLPDGASTLAGPDFVALNCVDRNSCPLRLSSTQRLRWCEIETRVHADGNGDFMFNRPSSDGALEDEFAEVQMYFHATTAMAKWRSLGFDHLAAQPMKAIVNLRMPEEETTICQGTTSTVKLEPHENAFFAPAGAIAGVFPEEDAMLFGQGETVDYAYDGDVIYHELTHAVMSTLTPMGVAALDERGFDGTMFAMHEGFADMFAAIISGDPDIAEYVGPALNQTAGPLRSLTNTKRCPANIVGEEHEDSELWSGALWQARTALGEADRPRFDQALYTVVDSLGELESFDTVRQKIEAEVGTRLGGPALATVRGVFEDRGLEDCRERIVPLDLGTSKAGLLLKGRDDIPSLTRVPGPVQLELTLKKDASQLRFTIDTSFAPSDTATKANLELVIKKNGPVTWTEDGTDDADFRGPIMIDDGDPGAGRANIDGDFEAGTYTVLFVNKGPTWLVARIRVSSDREGPGADPDSGGCGVALSGGAGAAPLILALLLGLRSARPGRRRRGSPGARPSPRA